MPRVWALSHRGKLGIRACQLNAPRLSPVAASKPKSRGISIIAQSPAVCSVALAIARRNGPMNCRCCLYRL